MEQDIYISELWEDLKQVLSNINYLDILRAKKAGIEPVYKGMLGIIATFSAVAGFIDVPYLAEAAAIITALGVIAPLFFPFLPCAADFSKMDAIRLSLKEYLAELELLWSSNKGSAEYSRYLDGKKRYAVTETEASAIFGEINEKWEKQALTKSERYLGRFFISS